MPLGRNIEAHLPEVLMASLAAVVSQAFVADFRVSEPFGNGLITHRPSFSTSFATTSHHQGHQFTFAEHFRTCGYDHEFAAYLTC